MAVRVQVPPRVLLPFTLEAFYAPNLQMMLIRYLSGGKA